MSFGSQKYDFRFKSVDILQVKISRKYNGVRSLTGVVTNKSSKEIEYIKFNIKIKDKNDNYYTVGEIRSYNLPPNKEVCFKTYLKVLDLDSKNLKVEIIDLIIGQK